MNDQNLLEHFIYNNGKSEYKLYSTGLGFKSIITDLPTTLRSGKKIEAYKSERRHKNLNEALNSKRRPNPVIIDEIVKSF